MCICVSCGVLFPCVWCDIVLIVFFLIKNYMEYEGREYSVK